ncbi:MAG: hypothetical protein A3J68_00885 [Candidatus Wildermuthbacteria bacterium RIFCSPHIGHO2_02_FULL_48_16]|uniref:Cell division protein FtsL n=1 Tax=Candidatus Wildermuthbacteria bacterium RIFCSPHIGHO2_02_FULL_48_16 TaxID=1802453 RepID=A0A1G2R650_9BACT|nr:MAG: hypothetical protein A3J68_00885 [Candidatus Wildermuthbacteria bacterium RIFCSPHIGHO2_02_FULL_48_16]
MQNIPLRTQFRKTRSLSARSAVFLFVFLGIFLGVVGFLAFQNLRIYQKRSELSNIAKELKAQVSALEQRKLQLEAGIVEVQSVEYQEKVLREQGLYQKPGEEVVTVLSPEQSQEQDKKQETRVWWNPTTWFK